MQALDDEPGLASSEGPKLRIVVFDDPTTCDPHAAYDSSSRHVVLNVYEPLVRYRPHQGGLVPWLAAKLPTGTATTGGEVEYCVAIRADVRDHSGHVITPADVVYSLRRTIVTAQGPAALWLEALLGRRVVAPSADEIASALARIQLRGSTVAITLARPFAPFTALLANWSLVLRRDWAVTQGEWDGTPQTFEDHLFPEHTALRERANGTGAFILESWNRHKRVARFRRHEAYWGQLPAAIQVELASEDDRIERETSLVRGQSDVAVCQPESLCRIRDTPSLLQDETPDEWHVNPLGFLTYKLDQRCEAVGSARFDGQGMRPDTLSDRDFRLALAFSFDHGAFCEQALCGPGIQHYGPFPRPSLADGPVPEFCFDLDRARFHLAKAWNGAVKKGGVKIVAYTHAGNYARVRAAQIHASGFNSLFSRCRMIIRQLPLGRLVSSLYASRCPIAWIGWDADYPDPYTFASQLLAEDSLLPAKLGLRLPGAKHLVSEARNAESAGHAQRSYRELAALAIREQTHVFVPGKVSYLNYRDRWQGGRCIDGVANVLDFASFRVRQRP